MKAVGAWHLKELLRLSSEVRDLACSLERIAAYERLPRDCVRYEVPSPAEMQELELLLSKSKQLRRLVKDIRKINREAIGTVAL